MKRISLLFIAFLPQINAFAQRGKVRPEWDFGGSVSHHSIDDDFYSFLSIIVIIIIVFIIAAIKGNKNQNKTKQRYEPSGFIKAIESIGELYSKIVGGGCLLVIVLAPIAFLITLVKDCGNDSSNKPKEKTEQRKEKTFVTVLYSDTDYNQIHIASKDEFIGKDTIFYYKSFVYQNKTGKTLAMYSVEYSIKGTKTIEIIKTISTDTYFDTGYIQITPFQKPPQSVDIPIPTNHSRWAKSQRTKATRT